jgi:hypothetical protein
MRSLARCFEVRGQDRDVLGSIGGCAAFDLLERGAGNKERDSRG